MPFVNEISRPKRNLTTPRANPQTVKVHVYTLVIKLNQLERCDLQTFDITLPLERMTEDEYNAAMNEAVAALPKAFQAYVQYQAWDQGHSAGYEEVVNIACSMAHDLEPVIHAYTASLFDEKKPPRT